MNQEIKNEKKVIALSFQIIRSFYSRKISEILPYLDENYLWIGGFSFQWTEGAKAFLEITKSESEETPPLITDQNYRLLLHSSDIWVVCGSYTASAQLDTDYTQQMLVRVTLVWRQKGGRFLLTHLHGSNASDSPMPNTDAIPSGSFYQYVKGLGTSSAFPRRTPPANSFPPTHTDETLALKDQSGHYRYLDSQEILYFKAANQWCQVFTTYDNFLTFGSLSGFERSIPGFLRTHRSYLVNPQAVVKLRFGKLWLWNETQLPIGKERYPQIKAELSKLLGL